MVRKKNNIYKENFLKKFYIGSALQMAENAVLRNFLP